MRLGSKRIKPGEVFEADHIPKAFRDLVEPLDGPLPEKKVKKEPVVLERKHKRARRSNGWYDVVDEDGNKVSDMALREHEADKLINELG